MNIENMPSDSYTYQVPRVIYTSTHGIVAFALILVLINSELGNILMITFELKCYYKSLNLIF